MNNPAGPSSYIDGMVQTSGRVPDADNLCKSLAEFEGAEMASKSIAGR